MDILKTIIVLGTGVSLLLIGPGSLAGHGASSFQDVTVKVTNEGTCSVNSIGGGYTITAPFPAQSGASPEIGVITVSCTAPGKKYAAISSSATGPWDTIATLTGSKGSIKAEIGKRTGTDSKTALTVMPSAGTVSKMVGNDTGDFDLQLTNKGKDPDSWTLYVLAGRWAD
ncbi:hypothetical protein ACJCYG_004715 [Enterobacter ludwigii]